MDPSTRTKPPAFPMPPKSALFSRLEAFLPVLASENEKLEAAIANGEGDRHNIEIPEDTDAVAEGDKQGAGSDSSDEDEEDDSDVDMDDDAKKPTKAPVIEFNFALGMMEEGGSDADSSDDEDGKEEIDLATSIAAARETPNSSEPASGLQLPVSKTATQQPTRPLIQELN